MPKVSIIIPTYNRADLLRLTVESVLAQTYPNIELIVIDDESTDQTPQVMAAYGDRIRYIRQPNQGPDAAVANGYALATGEYINFMDHDDLMMPTKIERQAAILNSDDRVGLVHCGYNHIDEKGKLLQNAIALPDSDVLKSLIKANFIWSGAPLIRRTCLEKVGLFDESIWCSDWDLWLRLAISGCGFHCIQEALGSYRILSYSIMSNTEELEKGVFATLDKAFKDVRLPSDILAIKNAVYCQKHFEISARYFLSQDWERAGHSLSRFLEMNPQVGQQPEVLWGYFEEDIVKNPRLTNPAAVMESIFDHLPDTAQHLRSYRQRFVAYAYIVQALRLFSAQQIEPAQRDMTEAIKQYPELLQNPAIFVKLLTAQAFNEPDDKSFGYVDEVLNNVPPNAHELANTRRWAQGDLYVVRAFQAYSSGQHSLVVGQVLKGLQRRPQWLKNKGVLSILLKSIKRQLHVN
jgi:glycosyltransferase involved in cell wall biosynthesis